MIEKSELFREAFKTNVRVQSAKRLAKLGGEAPKMEAISRRSGKSNNTDK
jgi:hypothetical protein